MSVNENDIDLYRRKDGCFYKTALMAQWMIYTMIYPLQGNNNRPGSGGYYGNVRSNILGTIIHLFVKCGAKLAYNF
jgi:hypothetical protein